MLAYTGAKRVADQPGCSYNPLFIYGGPGLGKTHLLQAIAHAIRERDPSLRVAYVSGEYFAQSYFKALRDKETEQFRRQYREVDVWLVDDIQFIASKEQTKEEFFHTFNSLHQNGKQIVIASDRSPRELNTLDERLRSRFQSGLIADINPPETETRIGFLKACRKRENAEVSDDVLLYIADAIQSNMRSLEGALTRLMAISSITKAPMSGELAHDVLGEYFITKPVRYRSVTIEGVIQAAAEHFGAAVSAIKGPGRNKDLSIARQVAMYLCRELIPSANTISIGAAFGGRDHATVVYACQRMRQLMEIDPGLKSTFRELSDKLTR
jgi:chromosomal replication initiator protein